MQSATALGIEKDFSTAADALRSNMDAMEYRHVVLDRVYAPCCLSNSSVFRTPLD